MLDNSRYSDKNSPQNEWLLVNIAAIVVFITTAFIYTYFVEGNVHDRFVYFDNTNLYDFMNPLMFVFNPHYYIYVIYKTYLQILELLMNLCMNTSSDLQFYVNQLDDRIKKTSIIKYYYFLIRIENYDTYKYVIKQITTVLSPKTTNGLYVILEGAWYLKFGYLFFLTTVSSLFCLSYLGLYGSFLINLPPLFLF